MHLYPRILWTTQSHNDCLGFARKVDFGKSWMRKNCSCLNDIKALIILNTTFCGMLIIARRKFSFLIRDNFGKNVDLTKIT